MAAWSLLLPALKRFVPVRRLVVLMWTDGRTDRSPEREREVIEFGARVTRARANCLERSLLVYRFLARAGADPHLVVGVGSVDGVIAGHAWVTVDGIPVHDPPETVQRFLPVIEFGREGKVINHSDAASGDRLPHLWR
jgi:Transglutaminase-like superfamily